MTDRNKLAGDEFDTRDVLARMLAQPAEAHWLAKALHGASDAIPANTSLPAPQFPLDPRAFSLANMLKGGLEAAGGWFDWQRKTRPEHYSPAETVAPLGMAAMVPMARMVRGVPEHPTAAAIKYGDQTLTGPSHSNIIMDADYSKIPAGVEGVAGFVTDRNNFISRDKARELTDARSGHSNDVLGDGSTTLFADSSPLPGTLVNALSEQGPRITRETVAARDLQPTEWPIRHAAVEDVKGRPPYPVVALRAPNGELSIIDGHHRTAAAMQRDGATIDAIIVDDALYQALPTSPNGNLDISYSALLAAGEKAAAEALNAQNRKRPLRDFGFPPLVNALSEQSGTKGISLQGTKRDGGRFVDGVYTIKRDGAAIGEMHVTVQDGVAHINSIKVEGGPGSLGQNGLTQLRAAFASEFPDVADFSGYRTTGAHAQAPSGYGPDSGAAGFPNPRQRVHWPSIFGPAIMAPALVNALSGESSKD